MEIEPYRWSLLYMHILLGELCVVCYYEKLYSVGNEEDKKSDVHHEDESKSKASTFKGTEDSFTSILNCQRSLFTLHASLNKNGSKNTVSLGDM